ncbi:hypothetical protein CMV30_16650 [Nibricoccus aquaticus]|uniref:Uncharacterized protein n=1 Tax=Nibricoccus aquaticus TaxID=2576891 RepID=A0A290QAI3_9BACT|nr:hypothetical protein [Nibricoccus aquaticus]ATC65443.1 hypothetical protein CMV30_16650 [Nibricoccus aquaticus]
MTPKSDNREHLLAETYHGDWSTGPAATFARNAARSARRRRTLRIALPISAVAALVFVAIPALREPTRIASISVSAPTTALPPSDPAPAYEIISDTELLTLVRDRPLLLIQNDTAPGSSRQIVTFDY